MKPLVAAMTLLLLAFLNGLVSVLAASRHAVTQFKAPNPETPSDQAEAWREEDEALHAYIQASVPDVLEHTGADAFDEHLHGVQSILRLWGSEKHLYNAGLFHSICERGLETNVSGRNDLTKLCFSMLGTGACRRNRGLPGLLPAPDGARCHKVRKQTLEVFEDGSPLNMIRSRQLIGEKAERLCWIFCMVDRWTVDETVFAWTGGDVSGDDREYTFFSRPELGRFPIHLDKSEWIDFIELTLADWLEQVEGAAETPSPRFFWKKGEAWSYRRTAYHQMANILSRERGERLSSIVHETVAAVYEREDESTRHLVQMRTPPMNGAAKEANAALRSAGHQVPTSFAPVPSNDSVADEL